MNQFVLDERLKNDCIELGKLGESTLLLMNTSLVPWFILVPHTLETELTDLPESKQLALLDEINWLSVYVKDNFNVTKLNTATIGNIVSQLHVHVVGRNPADYCWPKVVWGTKEREPYDDQRIKEIITALHKELNGKFIEKV